MPNEPERSGGKGRSAVIATVAAIIAAICALISVSVAIYSYRLNIIGAEVQWQSLLEGYNEVDTQVLEFEKAFHAQRGGPEVKTLSELNERLLALGVPPEVARLYRKRFEKYASLRNAAKQYSPFESRLSGVDFKLPSAPLLPAPGTPFLTND